jgi:hypothetical protein
VCRTRVERDSTAVAMKLRFVFSPTDRIYVAYCKLVFVSIDHHYVHPSQVVMEQSTVSSIVPCCFDKQYASPSFVNFDVGNWNFYLGQGFGPCTSK